MTGYVLYVSDMLVFKVSIQLEINGKVLSIKVPLPRYCANSVVSISTNTTVCKLKRSPRKKTSSQKRIFLRVLLLFIFNTFSLAYLSDLIVDFFNHIVSDFNAGGLAEHVHLHDQPCFFRGLDNDAFGSHQGSGDDTALLPDFEILVR